MTAPTQDLIDRLAAAAMDAREAAREAHEARKDLRQAIHEAKDEMRTLTTERMEEMLLSEMKRQVDEVRINEVSAGLKAALDRWTRLLDEASGVLRELNTYAERRGIRP